ncbi:hypothetical protein EJB05_44449, partial [Eragrostis curvula]
MYAALFYTPLVLNITLYIGIAAMANGDINTLRVLVETDCHFGYMEKDEICRFDSFQAFETICSLANKTRSVDYVLLGGNLFHENKPSRSTLVKSIEILRRYCLNDQPVKFQVVGDQTVNFPNRFGQDNLSAIYILSACNLVNYFGKMDLGGSGVGQIAVYPVLIKKGMIPVALYGLGNIRDERLNRMFHVHIIQYSGCGLELKMQSQSLTISIYWFSIRAGQRRILKVPSTSISLVVFWTLLYGAMSMNALFSHR